MVQYMLPQYCRFWNLLFWSLTRSGALTQGHPGPDSRSNLDLDGYIYYTVLRIQIDLASVCYSIRLHRCWWQILKTQYIDDNQTSADSTVLVLSLSRLCLYFPEHCVHWLSTVRILSVSILSTVRILSGFKKKKLSVMMLVTVLTIDNFILT